MHLTRTGGNYFTIAVALQCILLMVRLQVSCSQFANHATQACHTQVMRLQLVGDCSCTGSQ